MKNFNDRILKGFGDNNLDQSGRLRRSVDGDDEDYDEDDDSWDDEDDLALLFENASVAEVDTYEELTAAHINEKAGSLRGLVLFCPSCLLQ